MQLSMFSAAEPHANPSRLRACDKAWLTLAATSCSPSALLRTDIGQNGWFGKTCPECFPVMEGEILLPLSASWGNSGMGGPTEYWTLNTSEHAASPLLCPSDDAVCSLSDILETTDVPQRYYLTAKACLGILRRAAKRGKDLPMVLRQALQAVAEA